MPEKFLSRVFHWKKADRVQHVCDLTKGSESHLPRLPPNAQFSSRLKRRLQKILLVSSNHPLTRLHLRSKAAIAFERRRHGISSYWWVIHPCSNFRFAWDIIMKLTYLYMFFMIPHMISFYRLSKTTADSADEYLKVLTPGYIICIIDIILNFVTGFISHDGHEIFLDPVLILKHYAGGFFIIDLVSSIPYTWFYRAHFVEEPSSSNLRIYLLFLELLPLLKFFRVSTVRHYIKEIVVAFGASRVYELVIWTFWMTILIFHWAACLTYAFPFIYAYITKTSLKVAEGHVFKTHLNEKSAWLIYVTSLHIGGGNLCNYSFNEFQFTDYPDQITRCILLILGLAYFFYAIVIVLQLVISSVEPELKYQSIMHGVRHYISHKKLPDKLKERLLHFYEHRFQGSLFKEKAITSTLSNHLKHEITQHSSRILLESTPLFNNIPRSLLNSIIGALKQVIFLQDDIIYKCGMNAKCMYFIITGTVAIIDCSGEELLHVNDGDFFGETALIHPERKRFTTAIALEVCEVLRLDRRDFQRLVTPGSEFYSRLKTFAYKRIQDTTHTDNDNVNQAEITENDNVDGAEITEND